MISAKTVKTYLGYTIDRYTYSADVSAMGKPLTMFEVYNDSDDLLGAFNSLKDAIYYVDNQMVWDRVIITLPSHKTIKKY